MLIVHEKFMGLYETVSTTGEAIANIVSNVLICFSLPSNNLKAQTYDEAANMLKHFKRCQANRETTPASSLELSLWITCRKFSHAGCSCQMFANSRSN